MPGSIRIVLTPPDLLQRLRNAPAAVPRAIAQEMNLQNQLTIGHIVQRRMTGKGPFPPSEGRLGVKTGRLRGSLRATAAVVQGQTITSAIGTNVKYAGIHEFGGTIPAYVITARNKKSLRFVIGGKVLFRKSVNHPATEIPARAPIFRGIEDRAEQVGAALSGAALKALGGA